MEEPVNTNNVIDAGFSNTTDRISPSNLEAEQALLGALLLSNEAYYKVSSFLKPEHFYEPLHSRIYEAAEKMIASGRVADPVTLKPRFEDDPTMMEIGGVGYLVNLARSAVSIIDVADYGHAIFDMAIRRGLIMIGEEMVNTAYDSNAEEHSRAQIEAAEQHLYQLAEDGKYEGGFQSLTEAMVKSLDMTSKAFERDSHLSGLSTGITDLDAKLGGLQPSDLLILAGRPGMGKSSLACNIAFNVAKAYKVEKDENGVERVLDGAAVGLFS
jgi:replicative DNA helicase